MVYLLDLLFMNSNIPTSIFHAAKFHNTSVRMCVGFATTSYRFVSSTDILIISIWWRSSYHISEILFMTNDEQKKNSANNNLAKRDQTMPKLYMCENVYVSSEFPFIQLIQVLIKLIGINKANKIIQILCIWFRDIKMNYSSRAVKLEIITAPVIFPNSYLHWKS